MNALAFAIPQKKVGDTLHATFATRWRRSSNSFCANAIYVHSLLTPCAADAVGNAVPRGKAPFFMTCSRTLDWSLRQNRCALRHCQFTVLLPCLRCIMFGTFLHIFWGMLTKKLGNRDMRFDAFLQGDG